MISADILPDADRSRVDDRLNNSVSKKFSGKALVGIVTQFNGTAMIHSRAEASEPSKRWWTAIWSDVHFWVPLIVLLIGVLLLRFVR